MEEFLDTFEELNLTRQFLNAVDDLGYTETTTIQRKTIPLIMAGHDVLGIAQTGTGKTAAFLLPILQKLKYAQGNHPRAIVIAPSKELVLQIEQNAKELSKYTDLRTVAIYGGIGPKTQIEELGKGCDLVISTPKRLWELYVKEALLLKEVKTMILDEADKLMDMGFMPQLRNILEIVPRKRQNLLFSATFPKKVESLSQEFLDFPERVEASRHAVSAGTVRQSVIPVPNFLTKINLLGYFLEQEKTFKKVIVFVNTKKTADNIHKFISRKVSDECRVIHSNKGQNVRINAINDFKEGKCRILVTTDVSARGIDVPDVSHVINFEIPSVLEEYVHRIGRTGRAKKKGTAIAFANEGEMMYIKDLRKKFGRRINEWNFPKAVQVEDTPKAERTDINRIIDKYKRWKDPEYKGAFHEKKSKAEKQAKVGRKSGPAKKNMSRKNTAYGKNKR